MADNCHFCQATGSEHPDRVSLVYWEPNQVPSTPMLAVPVAEPDDNLGSGQLGERLGEPALVVAARV